MSAADSLVVLAVIGVRFLVPLLILRFPLPAILVCLGVMSSQVVQPGDGLVASDG